MDEEWIKCPNHNNSYCLLKTGLKSGPSQGISFYMCGQCNFNLKTSFPTVNCTKHPTELIELQSFHEVSQETGKTSLRKYFRCQKREEGKSWCGYASLDKKSNTLLDRKNSSKLTKEVSAENLEDSSISAEETPLNDVVSSQVEENKLTDMSVSVEPSSSKESSSLKSNDQSLMELSFAELSKSHHESNQTKSQNSDLKLDSLSFKSYRDSPKSSVRPKSISNFNQQFTENKNLNSNAKEAKPACNNTDSSTLDLKSLKQALPQTCVTAGDDHKDSKSEKTDTLHDKVVPSSHEKDSLNTEAHSTEESLQSLIDKKQTYSSELHKIQASLRAVNLSNLPDKGQKILQKLSHFQESIKEIDRQINALPKQVPAINKSSATSHTFSAGVNKITVMSTKVEDGKQKESSSGSLNQPVRQHLPQFAHLPEHLQQMLASNPQAMTLYGGRMTAQRMREVGSITTEAIDKIHKQLESCPSETEELPDPKGLKVPLMPHQRHALAWLAWREQQHPPGGILADDMGLGKTLTMLSHILNQKVAIDSADQAVWLNRKKEVEKLEKGLKKSRATFIITPASLIHQWAKEIDRRFQPGLLKYILYHGPDREKNVHKLLDVDIVISTYQIVAKEVGADKKENAESPMVDEEKPQAEDLPMLLKIGWERIVLDEAHNIKNHKSATAMSICKLRCLSRWALTGTPIQNDLTDMYALLRFLRFSPFDEYKVWKKHVDLAKGSTTRLNTIVKALLLRRTKDQTSKDGKPLVALPSRSKETILVELGPEERAVYDKLFRKTQSTVQAYVERHQDKNEKLTPPKTTPHPHAQTGSYLASSAKAILPVPAKATGSQILVLLLRLQQCCSHLSLMKSQIDSDILEADGIELSLEEQMRGMILDEVAGESQMSQKDKINALFEKTSLSTKLKYVIDKIKALHSEHSQKCVIVSQWTQMLDIIGCHLEKARISYSVIQGNIPPKKRSEIVDDFNLNKDGVQVMLLSLKAGGVGLNLTGGNHLFILDTHWNPALEEQACDRIYRMGQQKDVFIYRFVCKDTIEEKISNLQKEKLSLARSVLSGTGARGQKLSLHDLRSLFGV
uniref:Transcription termination factor 2 n=1 Tax=Biomphalaria glabrata TaxID=6526 RepID=A0A2C9K2C0_BIOGL